MKKMLALAAGLGLVSSALAQPAPVSTSPQPASMDNAPDAVADVPTETYEPVAEHSNSMIYSGMGGPVEERTDYPPCRPGAGDDNCIQLYERGVTGVGN